MNPIAYKLGQIIAMENMKVGNAYCAPGTGMPGGVPHSPLSAVAPQMPTNMASPPAIPRGNPVPAMPTAPAVSMPKMALFISDPTNPEQRTLAPSNTRQPVQTVQKAQRHMTVQQRLLHQ